MKNLSKRFAVLLLFFFSFSLLIKAQQYQFVVSNSSTCTITVTLLNGTTPIGTSFTSNAGSGVTSSFCLSPAVTATGFRITSGTCTVDINTPWPTILSNWSWGLCACGSNGGTYLTSTSSVCTPSGTQININI